MRYQRGGPFPRPPGLAGLVAGPLAVLIQPALDAAMAAVARRHRAVFERLGPEAGAAVLIEPTDLPVRLLLRADPEAPRLALAGPGEKADATVRGPVLALVDLLEGRIDGDALFFSRELHVEGRTEAVVALRNAVDGEEIRLLDDVLSLFGPLADPVRRGARTAGRALAALSRDLEIVAGAFTAPPRRAAAGGPAAAGGRTDRAAPSGPGGGPR